jgi:hypothetical protein
VGWRSIEVNLVGAYHTARATLPRMLEAGKGTVINISSGAAHGPLDGWSAYCSGIWQGRKTRSSKQFASTSLYQGRPRSMEPSRGRDLVRLRRCR